MSDPALRIERSHGHIELICGPMFSGKTEELIRRLKRAQIARQRVVVFKPKIDDRYDPVEIVSHSSMRIKSVPLSHSSEIEALVAQNRLPAQVVGIDEAQFFDEGIVAVASRLAERGVRVIIAGLDTDYLGRPFGPMPLLMCEAESVTKQLAVCIVCGAPASRSQRVHPDAMRFHVRDGLALKLADAAEIDQVLVGGGDSYEARCRQCFSGTIDTPAMRPGGER